MVKGEIIMLRVSAETKAAIKAAAARGGKSVSTFVSEAIVKEAARAGRRPVPKGVHGGVPTFFRACCYEAANGGASGYAGPGWHLSNSLSTQIPNDVESDDWQEEIDALKELLSADDGDGVWAWFKRHYPKCMQLVPTRRREQFVAGVQGAYEEGRIES